MNYQVRYSDIYLAHHGILGQKWGKRNGPPYPLDSGDHSASERKAGWRKSLKQDKADRAREEANAVRRIASKKSFNVRRLERAADASAKDAEDLRKHGFIKEAEAVQKVSDKQRAKAAEKMQKKADFYDKYASAMERKADKRQAQADAENQKKLSDKQKKALIIGGSLAAAGLAAYGLSKIGGKQLTKEAIARGESEVSRLLKAKADADFNVSSLSRMQKDLGGIISRRIGPNGNASSNQSLNREFLNIGLEKATAKAKSDMTNNLLKTAEADLDYIKKNGAYASTIEKIVASPRAIKEYIAPGSNTPVSDIDDLIDRVGVNRINISRIPIERIEIPRIRF